MTDRTTRIEEAVLNESQPKIKHLTRLWRFAVSSAPVISAIYLGAYTLLSLLRPLLALIWGRYIDLVSVHLPGGELLPMIALIVIYYVINFLAGLIEQYVVPGEDIQRLDIVQANRFQELMDTRLYKKLAAATPELWEVPKINDTVDRTFRFTSDKWSGMSSTVMMQSYVVIAKLISVISVAASLCIYSPWLGLIVLLAPLPTLYTQLVGERLKFRFVKENSVLERRAGYYQDLMLKEGAKEIKTMGLFDFFFGKWKAEMDEYARREKKMSRSRALINMGNNLISGLTSVAANILAIVLMSLGRISIGALGATMSLISTLIGDMRSLVSASAAFVSKKNEAALFSDLVDLPEQSGGSAKPAAFESLEATNIRYRYPLTEPYVLDGASIKICRGEKVAFVGENGAGKTTLVKLITGILSPSEGELRINGAPTDDWPPDDRYAQLGTVSQAPARYTTFTIAENVYLGDTLCDPDDDRIGDALKFAGLGAIDRDALLGKDAGGTDLSGGEWQKLAIARACYRNKDFIILDEPTSNLDPLAETEVFNRYIRMAEDKTVIFVTHRISVAALAERIVVFDGGRIVEDGSHGELICRGGLYARLYKEQAKWYDR